MPIIDCPKCRKSLQLPDQYAGKLVQCPHCQETFNAAPAAVSPAPLPPPVPSPPQAVAVPSGPKAKDSWEDEDDRQRPSRRPRRRYEDDEDDDYGARARRTRHDQKPHRGAAVLTLGILSLVVCPILGPIAWVMGSNDLREIADGRMDRSGESITRAGRIIGIVGTILCILWICGIPIFITLAGRGFRSTICLYGVTPWIPSSAMRR